MYNVYCDGWNFEGIHTWSDCVVKTVTSCLIDWLTDCLLAVLNLLLFVYRLMREAVKLVDKCMFLNVLLETRNADTLSTYDSFPSISCHCLPVLYCNDWSFLDLTQLACVLLLFGSKLGFGRMWKHFIARFNRVHAFGYNCAGSEPIWMKFGALWAHCLPLTLADFGARSAQKRQRDSEVNFFFLR